MYTIEELRKGVGIFSSGVTKIYICRDWFYYTCQKNENMRNGEVWGYAHWEGDYPVLESC